MSTTEKAEAINHVLSAEENSTTGQDRQMEVHPWSNEGKVVCIAVDGTPVSEHAVEWYMDNVHHPGNIVIFIHNFEIPGMSAYHIDQAYAATEMWQVDLKRASSKALDLKRRLLAKLKRRRIPGKFVSRGGTKPGVTIVDVAKEHGADMIVVGTHSHSKLHRVLMGSVSSYVMHHAHCPVIVCRPKGACSNSHQSGPSVTKLSVVAASSAPDIRPRSSTFSGETTNVQKPKLKTNPEFDMGEMRQRAGSGSSLLKQVLKRKVMQH